MAEMGKELPPATDQQLAARPLLLRGKRMVGRLRLPPQDYGGDGERIAASNRPTTRRPASPLTRKKDGGAITPPSSRLWRRRGKNCRRQPTNNSPPASPLTRKTGIGTVTLPSSRLWRRWGKNCRPATDQQLAAGLSFCAENGHWNSYASLLKTMAETGKATDQQLRRPLLLRGKRMVGRLRLPPQDYGGDGEGNRPTTCRPAFPLARKKGIGTVTLPSSRLWRRWGKNCRPATDQQLAAASPLTRKKDGGAITPPSSRLWRRWGKNCRRQPTNNSPASLLRGKRMVGQLRLPPQDYGGDGEHKFSDSQYTAIREHIGTLPRKIVLSPILASPPFSHAAATSRHFHKKEGRTPSIDLCEKTSIAVNDALREETKKVRDRPPGGSPTAIFRQNVVA